jgi:hypothetical protein
VAPKPQPKTTANAGEQQETKSTLANLKRAASQAEGSKTDAEGVGTQVANMSGKILTGKILNYCWADVADLFVSTFGLSLVYINFHFIMKYVASVKFFCEFGEEWTMKGATGGAAGQAENQSAQTASSALKWGEIIAMFLLDIIVVLLIAAVLYAAYASVSWEIKAALWVGEKTGLTSTIIDNVVN